MQDTWLKRKSDPQPITNVTIKAIPSDILDIGIKPSFNKPTVAIKFNALADTGCQSTLGGLNVLQSLHLSQSQLIPVNMKMTAANNKRIEIIGALPLRISGTSTTGEVIYTRQLVYFTPATDKLFLSKNACTALGLISKNFPSIGESLEVKDNVSNPESAITRKCHCPKRTMPPPPPKTLPFLPTEENVPKLRQFLLDYYKGSTFNVCEHQVLPMMSGPPLRLMINPNATPYAIHKPIPIPIHFQEDIYEGLKRDERLGVIESVPVGTPVTWCHKMVVVPKKNGKPRRTVDLQPLNKHAIRETHHTEAPFHQARAVPPNTYKTVTDAWNGYHSIPLHEDDKHMTTFITPKGRFRYKVAPQGYISSGDGYTRRFDEIIMDFPNKTKCVDDTLTWSDSIENAFYQAVQWLDLCGRNGIVLNPSKFVFCQKTVDFAGFTITSTSVKPVIQCLEAIKKFPSPKNITDVRSWFGLINQVSYAFAAAERMLPFRDLLKPGKPFKWNEQLEDLFNESKAIIVEEIRHGVEIYDKSKPTCLATDWCKDGIGFWLLQKHCSCPRITPLCCPSGWKIALVGSRFTSAAESRYSPIEGEALAVVDALRKARHFVLGCSELIVAVDHKPLLKIFSDRSLEDIHNTRLLNLKEKTLPFRFNIMHVPGVRHKAADAVSRHPIGESNEVPLPDDISSILATAIPHDFLMSIRSNHFEETEICETQTKATIVEAVSWDDVRLETTSDPALCKLIEHIENGFPLYRDELNSNIRQYYQFREHLTTYDGVILYNERVVIPPPLRDKILISLHSAHQGISQMCSRAEASVFWPGMTTAIKNIREQCTSCSRIAPSQPSAPPTPPIMPLYPFQAIAADFFTYRGTYYLVAVDRYSNWPIVETSNNGSKGLISALRKIFTTFGISEELTSDGGPEFISGELNKFLSNWGVKHRISSAYFAHSNCRAEIGVKTVKRMLMDNTGSHGTLDIDKFQRAILNYRNTPDRDTGLSPAMCVFGRSVRDFIPVHPGRYLPHPTWRQTLVAREEALRNRHQKICERLTEHTQNLPPLKVGDHVRVQNQYGPHPKKWDKTGLIVEVRQFHQYIIKMDGSGRVTMRNRQFLRKYIPAIPKQPVLNTPEKLSQNPTVQQHATNVPINQKPLPPTVSFEPSFEPQTLSKNSSPVKTTPTNNKINITPQKVISRTFIRSPIINSPTAPKSSPPQYQQTRQSTELDVPPTPAIEPELLTEQTESTVPSQSERSDPTPSSVPPVKPKKIPLALKQLQTFNNPGIAEQDIESLPEKRVRRQSTRLT